MINVGVIGFGLSAKTFHIPFICALPEYTLTAICTSQTLAVSKQHPQVAAHHDAQSLLAQQDLQLVVITAPNDVHFSLAKQCLEAGKHLIIEKPITSTVAEAETLAELAERHQRQVSVYHNRRWDGDLLTIAALLEQKTLATFAYSNPTSIVLGPQSDSAGANKPVQAPAAGMTLARI